MEEPSWGLKASTDSGPTPFAEQTSAAEPSWGFESRPSQPSLSGLASPHESSTATGVSLALPPSVDHLREQYGASFFDGIYSQDAATRNTNTVLIVDVLRDALATLASSGVDTASDTGASSSPRSSTGDEASATSTSSLANAASAANRATLLPALSSVQRRRALRLLQAHLPTAVRLAHEAPFGKVRKAFAGFVAEVREAGDVVALLNEHAACASALKAADGDAAPPVSSLFSENVVPLDPDERELHALFRTIFLQTGRVSHLVRLLAWHPTYLRCYWNTWNALFYEDSALALPWRFYIAALAAARHRCHYLVRLCEHEFLALQGDPRWLDGVEYSHSKLRRVLPLVALLAYQPWRITADTMNAILAPGDTPADAWSLSELLHVILIVVAVTSTAGIVFAVGVTPEVDLMGDAAEHQLPMSPPQSRSVSQHAIASATPQPAPPSAAAAAAAAAAPSAPAAVAASSSSGSAMLVPSASSSSVGSASDRQSAAEEQGSGNDFNRWISLLRQRAFGGRKDKSKNKDKGAKDKDANSATQQAATPQQQQQQQQQPPKQGGGGGGESPRRSSLEQRVSSEQSRTSAESQRTSNEQQRLSDESPRSSVALGKDGKAHAAFVTPSPPDSRGGSKIAKVDREFEALDSRAQLTRNTSASSLGQTSLSSSQGPLTSSDGTAAAAPTSPTGGCAKYMGHVQPTATVDFDMRSKEYRFFRVHDYSWAEHGFSLVSRYYTTLADYLDEQFNAIYTLTYNTFSDVGEIDTSPFRSAIWHYAHRLKGLFHDDYDYHAVNVYLNRQIKTYVKKSTTAPETVTADDVAALGKFTPAEKVHMCLLAVEARKQADLTYALFALTKHMR